VRLVFEPKTRTVEQQELITILLAHTSLETSSPINMTMIGAGRQAHAKEPASDPDRVDRLPHGDGDPAHPASPGQGAATASTSSKAASSSC
jgi:hypothetical protein